MFRNFIASVFLLLTFGLQSAENLQSWNGVARANVQTWNGVAIANVQSWNGIDNTGASCPADGSPSEVNDTTAGSNTYGAGRLYFGQSQWQDGGTPRTICKIGMLMRGNGTGKTFTATIWTMTGINLNAVQATSDGVAGANWSSDTWVYYTFPTPFLTTSAVNYALLVAPDSAMAGNDMTGYSGNTSHVGYRDMFSAAGAADQAAGNDAAIKIYWQ